MKHLDVQTLTEMRFATQQDRMITQQGHGSTEGGLAIVARYLKETSEILEGLKVPEELSLLSNEIIALVCLQAGLNSVGAEDTLMHTIYHLGKAGEREVYAQKLRNKVDGNRDQTRELARMEMGVIRRHGRVECRKVAMRKAAQKAGLGTPDWEGRKHAKVGGWLLDVCLMSPAFERVKAPFDRMMLSSEAEEHASGIIEYLLANRPHMLPLMEPPSPWKAAQTNISGYKHLLVRKHDKEVQATIRRAIYDGSMDKVLEAINGIQSTAFKVNHFIADMIKWTFANRVQIEGFPRDFDLPAPEKEMPWEMMTEDQQRLWKKQAGSIARMNRTNDSETQMLKHDLAVVDHIGQAPFWVPANVDYRGRVYSIGNFNFQRQDHIRALFLFDEGKLLDADGLYWLKVHLANCGDFGKVSKAPFDDRVKWVDDNWERLMDMSVDPTQDLWWTEADKPFLFLAACRAIMDSLYRGAVCSIPVSFDGACSGIQHLASMTKDEETAALVGLLPTEKPGDIYQTVASLVEMVIKADIGSEYDELAQKCLDYGVTRNLCKRNVMTYSYSSGQFGMAQQQYDDTMIPLADKVTEGKLPVHPFEVAGDTTTLENGNVLSRPGHMASRYLAKRIYASIKEVVKRPAEAMQFLQGCARATAHEGKPLVWHTPLGFPVVLRCPEQKTNRVQLWLHDKGVKSKFVTSVNEETKGISKTKAAASVSPGVVHSMDACHLQQVVRLSNAAGINSVVLVHDSFGCLPTDAKRFREIIKEGFVWLYQHDVLAGIKRETEEQVETNHQRIPALPEYGCYNVNQIKEAEYAFA